MSQDDEVTFLPYEEAVKIVAAIQEEEDIHQENHRILSVYNHADQQICWFDFAEVLSTVTSPSKEQEKELVSDYILHHIPSWALDI